MDIFNTDMSDYLLVLFNIEFFLAMVRNAYQY